MLKSATSPVQVERLSIPFSTQLLIVAHVPLCYAYISSSLNPTSYTCRPTSTSIDMTRKKSRRRKVQSEARGVGYTLS